MSKLIIFDLDGVLVEAKEIHFDSLNLALKDIDEKFVISWEDHLRTYDGLKTYDKLNLLSKYKGLPLEKTILDKIFNKKQDYTLNALSNLGRNLKFISLFEQLKLNGYIIACCSNSVEKTVILSLTNLGIINYFDLILSNESVKYSKPHPEIYWKAMSYFGALPSETLIVEDSPTGLTAAFKSGAKVLRVQNTNDFDFEKLNQSYNSGKQYIEKWVDKKMNVLIPMAGNGSRFAQAGYTFPKPLIEVHGKPMIQVVVENLAVEANHIFVVQKLHREKYNLDSMLSLICPGCKIVEVDSVTEGAACTVLLAKELIDNDEPLVIANSDQFIEWNSLDFFYKMSEQNLDAGIVSFKATHPKWSYAKVDDNGFVTKVAEKNPISDIATVGVYYWKKGRDFVKYAESMISKDIRVNNEFYVCPVFNEALLDGLKIKTFDVPKMWGIGTPEDLNYFLENYKKV
jgi:beta-phosphoglucomutase-like phosphatase (HAD superfamily)/dTDP-glucose pyrophosphorylase